jgi:hypothetical protein
MNTKFAFVAAIPSDLLEICGREDFRSRRTASEQFADGLAHVGDGDGAVAGGD